IGARRSSCTSGSIRSCAKCRRPADPTRISSPKSPSSATPRPDKIVAMTIRLPSGIDIDHFASLGAGFMSAKMLCVASELGLFEKLAAGPLTLDELQVATGLPRRGLRVLANGMVALGVLAVEGGKYKNSEAAQAWLAGNQENDMR